MFTTKQPATNVASRLNKNMEEDSKVNLRKHLGLQQRDTEHHLQSNVEIRNSLRSPPPIWTAIDKTFS